jgi:hypothetical protein
MAGSVPDVGPFYFSIGAGVGGGDNSWVVSRDCLFTGARQMNKAANVLIANLKFTGLPATNTPVAGPDTNYIYTLGTIANGKIDVKVPLRKDDTLYFYFSAESAVICFFEDFPPETSLLD